MARAHLVLLAVILCAARVAGSGLLIIGHLFTALSHVVERPRKCQLRYMLYLKHILLGVLLGLLGRVWVVEVGFVAEQSGYTTPV